MLKRLAMWYLTKRHGALAPWQRLRPPLGWNPYLPPPRFAVRARYVLANRLWRAESRLHAWARPPFDYSAFAFEEYRPRAPEFTDGAGI